MESPLKTDEQSINPRDYLARHGHLALARKLYVDGGYIIQEETLYDFCEALQARLPLLPEGEPGSGKTALAEATGEAFNLTRFFIPCHEELTKEELLFEFDVRARDREIKYRVEYDKMERSEAEQVPWSKRFIRFGEVFAAYDFAQSSPVPPVLTLDEVEKLRAAHEILLYEIFARHYGHVLGLEPSPVIGCTREGVEPPIVFATSNNMKVGDKRGDKDSLSRPFRDRFIVTFVNTPTKQEKPAILLAKVPDAAPDLLAGLCKIANGIDRDSSVPTKPTLRNLISCLASFVRDGCTFIDYEPFVRRLCYFGKEEKQKKNLKNAARHLVNLAHDPHAEIDEWVARAFEIKRNMQLNSFDFAENLYEEVVA